jgi:hypothetical protein
MNDRVGTVWLVGLHQLFSNGFLSREDSSAEPGGLSILLCRPKVATSGPTASNRDKACVREYMDLDVDDEIIRCILKKEYFIPQHVHDTKIQIKTFQILLALVKVRRGVITRGLNHKSFRSVSHTYRRNISSCCGQLRPEVPALSGESKIRSSTTTKA